jgi:hypothetical protein
MTLIRGPWPGASDRGGHRARGASRVGWIEARAVRWGGADRIATRDGGCTLSDPAEGVGALRCFGTQPQYRIRVGVEMKRRLDERKPRMLGRGFQLPCKPTRPLQPAVGNRVDPRIAP